MAAKQGDNVTNTETDRIRMETADEAALTETSATADAGAVEAAEVDLGADSEAEATLDSKPRPTAKRKPAPRRPTSSPSAAAKRVSSAAADAETAATADAGAVPPSDDAQASDTVGTPDSVDAVAPMATSSAPKAPGRTTSAKSAAAKSTGAKSTAARKPRPSSGSKSAAGSSSSSTKASASGAAKPKASTARTPRAPKPAAAEPAGSTQDAVAGDAGAVENDGGAAESAAAETAAGATPAVRRAPTKKPAPRRRTTPTKSSTVSEPAAAEFPATEPTVPEATPEKTPDATDFPDATDVPDTTDAPDAMESGDATAAATATPAEPEPAEPAGIESTAPSEEQAESPGITAESIGDRSETPAPSRTTRASSWWKATRAAAKDRLEANRANRADLAGRGEEADGITGDADPAVVPALGTALETEPGERPVVLSIRGLVKRYGGTTAVENVDLDVRAGSFYGIVGPNGAGKTTTLSITTGLLRPDAGTVTILGTDVWQGDASKAKRALGVLPDRLRLFDRLTGAQFLYYAGVLRGLDGATARKRSADLADAFGLHDALGRLVSDYSVGMTKKVAIAAAIIHSPRVLVLDEPFESVDPVSAATVTEILQRYVRGGGTVLLSSHSMDLVERICDSVAVIVDGHVLASGTVDEVRAGKSLEERFVELAGGSAASEGMEWLHTFSD